MKVMLVLTMLFVGLFIIACPAQPKSDYEISSDTVSGAVKYYFFLEKADVSTTQLIQGIDYKHLSDITLNKGSNIIPSFIINLDNDGSIYTVGVVAENISGIYGGMGVSYGIVEVVPGVPAGVTFRKK